MTSQIPLLHFFLIVLAFSVPSLASNHVEDDDFLKCIFSKFRHTINASHIIYTPESSSYLSVLDYSAQNLRFTTPQTPRPLVIFTPTEESHIQDAILCSRKYNIQVRIRSGGHDLEGLSYVSQVPFAVIDMRNFQSVQVNAEEATAWVETAATLGQIHYYIAKKSRTLAFPTGTCPTVGAGGHISGGGIGMLVRKYGLSADHVIDARLIDVNGRILDRKSMGEDFFWAIRGGGGASFGVILSWKLKLVAVPPKVTVFTVDRTLEQNATKLIYQWQSANNKIDKDLSWRIFLTGAINPQDGRRTAVASFLGLYLGGIESLLPMVQKAFPELGLAENDCKEMSWIESVAYFYTGTVDDLLNRAFASRFHLNLKLKSDFVKEKIPEHVFESVCKRFNTEELGQPWMVLTGLGGKMGEIPASELPFPHRGGNLYLMEYQALWTGGGEEAAAKNISWTSRIHRYMTPYVSKSPREAYLNYRDLGLGVNNIEGNTSYAKAKTWGEPYYVGNFKRLAYVKTLVDPSNFFRFEQSVPLLHR